MNQPAVDATLETDPLRRENEPSPPGQPVVVIEYRSRGIPLYVALSILLISMLSSVAVYHRISTRARFNQWTPIDRALAAGDISATSPARGDQRPAGPGEPAPGRGNSAQSLTPAFPGFPVPLALNSQPIPPARAPAAPAVAAIPVPASPADPGTGGSAPRSEASPATGAKAALAAPPPTPGSGDPPRDDPPPPPAPKPLKSEEITVGFNLPADDGNPFAELAIARRPPRLPDTSDTGPAQAGAAMNPEQPPPSREELLEEIKAEAAAKKTELEKLQDLKARAREAVEAESLARVEEERAVFHRELSQIVDTAGREAGRLIDELCEKYGRNYDPVLRGRVGRALARVNGRMSRQDRVRLLRRYGVPEAGILDYLANDLHRYINSRNGPRDSNQVRVNAAKQLLGIGLGSVAGGSRVLHARAASAAARDRSGIDPDR